jgi:hypothetical protein
MEKRSYIESPERSSGFSQAVVNENTLANPVYVVDCGFALTGFSLSNSSVAESLNNELVGVLSVDFGGLSPFTYEITSNPSNLFKISNDNELRTNAEIDFDVNPSVDIEITVSDSAGRSFAQDFTITVIETAFISNSQTEFNGVDEYITFGQSLRFQREDAFSISFWFELDATTGTQVFVGNQVNGGGFPGYSVYNNSGQLSFDLYGSFTGARYIAVETSSSVISSNTRYHACMTYDGSSDASGVTLYLNGVSQGLTEVNNNISGSINYGSVNFQLSGIDGANFLMDGTLDEVSIYEIELSSSQVSEIYNSGDVADISDFSSYSDCLAWFRMGEGSTAPSLNEEISGTTATMVNMNSSNFVSL